MSVFDGEMDLNSVYRVDYVDKTHPVNHVPNPKDDNCLIVGISRDALKVREDQKPPPDVLCPLEQEYYKTAVERFRKKHANIAKKYMSQDLDPKPIENEIQDSKRTEYMLKYCPRDLPFMSVHLSRRVNSQRKVQLPGDIDIPATTHRNHFRHPPENKYVEHSSKQSLKPKYDDTLQKELRRILKVSTGDSTYTFLHGLLGDVIKEKNPFGPPREEPKYGRWRDQYFYTFRI